MTFRAYLVLMGLSTAMAWVGWLIVLLNVDPFRTNFMGIVLFYVTLSVGLVGLLTLGGLLYRVGIMRRNELISREVKVSFRHAILLTVLSVIALILSRQGVLHWWVLVVLIVTAGILEYLSLLVQQSRRG